MRIRLHKTKQWYTIELKVQEEVAQRATAQAHICTEQMRKMHFLAKVPRMHDEYLSKHGVDPFIEKFTAIINEYESKMEAKRVKEQALKDKLKTSVLKHKVQARLPETKTKVGLDPG